MVTSRLVKLWHFVVPNRKKVAAVFSFTFTKVTSLLASALLHSIVNELPSNHRKNG
jgi:hypothetical protein